MRKVLIVEDDDSIREMLSYALLSAGFEVGEFCDGESFERSIDEEAPSIVLLDIMLPGKDGITLLKKLRSTEKNRNLPVILLTAKGAEIDRIKGLDFGADDYITKPFSVLEVISRINAVLRRVEENTTAPRSLTVSGVSLFIDKHLVKVGKEEIRLTFKEFELLRYLMENEGIVLSRTRIVESVWGYDYIGESRTVDMHVKSLRQKLGKASGIIKTVRNVGYQCVGSERK